MTNETVYERAQRAIDESRFFLNRLPEHLHEDSQDRDTQGLASAFYFDDEEPTKARAHNQKSDERDTHGLASAFYFDDEEPTKARAHNQKSDERDTHGLASAFYYDDEMVQ